MNLGINLFVLLETVFLENCFPETVRGKCTVNSYSEKQKSKEIEIKRNGLNTAGILAT